jgi:hypothetical protein
MSSNDKNYTISLVLNNIKIRFRSIIFNLILYLIFFYCSKIKSFVFNTPIFFKLLVDSLILYSAKKYLW